MSTLFEFSLSHKQEIVEDLKGQMESLKNDIEDYKNSLLELNEAIQVANASENLKEVSKLIKVFYTNLKEQLYENRNENYKLIKEVQHLNREKVNLAQQVQFCEQSIADLEKTVGISASGGRNK